MMPFVKPIDLPGKVIRCRSGYDGHEPADILRESRRLSETDIRFVVVIASDYPDSLCDAYVNKDVLGLAQRAIAENGLHVVCADIFRPGTSMPEEQPGSLSEEEDYLLVDDREAQVGRLRLWMYSWSSGGEFYGEFDLVVDMVIPKSLHGGIRSSLGRLADTNSVEVIDFGAAPELPRRGRDQGLLRRLIGRLW
jgi:hypothetical protein